MSVTLAEQLRAIAERLEDAERDRLSAMDALQAVAAQTPEAVTQETNTTPSSPSPRPANTPVACPECGAMLKPQGLGPHRSRKHGVSGGGRKTKRREPARNRRGRKPPRFGKPAAHETVHLVNGRETFLCNRCTASFANREDMLAHMQKGHPPTTTPRPVGEQPVPDFGAKGYGE